MLKQPQNNTPTPTIQASSYDCNGMIKTFIVHKPYREHSSDRWQNSNQTTVTKGAAVL